MPMGYIIFSFGSNSYLFFFYYSFISVENLEIKFRSSHRTVRTFRIVFIKYSIIIYEWIDIIIT